MLFASLTQPLSIDVAQVQAVFMPKIKNVLPTYLSAAPLLYVHYFCIMLLPAQTSVGLYQVECMWSSMAWESSFVSLTDVVLAVDLVSIFCYRHLVPPAFFTPTLTTTPLLVGYDNEPQRNLFRDLEPVCRWQCSKHCFLKAESTTSTFSFHISF